jgi:hypothetical protein
MEVRPGSDADRPTLVAALGRHFFTGRLARARSPRRGHYARGASSRQIVRGEALGRIDDRLKADGMEQVEGVLRSGQLRVDDRVRRAVP